MQPAAAPPALTLRRELGRWDLTAIGVNQVIGSAVFILPSQVAAQLGAWSPVGFLAVGFASLLVGLCFAEVGSRFDGTGGPYLYTRAAFGRFVAFEVGWMQWFTRVTGQASVVNAIALALGFYWPVMTVGVGRVSVITAVTLAIGWINLRGIRQSAVAINLLTIAKLAPLALFIVVGFWFVDVSRFTPLSTVSLTQATTGALLLVFAFGGYDLIGIPAGEAADPRRHVPFAIVTTIVAVTAIMTLAQLVAMGTLSDLPASTTPLADASLLFMGGLGALLVSAGSVVAMAGNNVGGVLAGSRMLFALAEHGELPRFFRTIHRRHRTPSNAVVFSTLVALGLALSGSFAVLAVASAVARLVTYIGSCAATIRLRHASFQGVVRPAAFVIPAGPLVPLLAIAVSLLMLAGATRQQLLGGVAALMAGGVLFVANNWRGIRMTRQVLAVLIVLLPAAAIAQTNAAAQAARSWRQQHERAIVDEFVDLLSIPNIASDRENIQRNAAAIAAMMKKRSIEARLVSVPGGNPIVFGEIRTPGATRTVGFYAHYDGQPLDPKEWTSPPFEPTLRDRRVDDGGRAIPRPPTGATFDPEWRLYARGAADDKAPIVAIMTAIDAVRDAGVALKSNVKFAFEGEEEAGSPNLERTLAAHKDLFAADLWLMCDAPLYQTRQQSIIFGARGVTRVDITVYGPRTELHSGHYGNWAPNPAMSLARLLASMKDDSGRVLVEHFYDDVEPLGPVERQALAEAPAIDAPLMRELWLGTTDGRPQTLNELIAIPSLNIRGMASSRIGAQASNVIPSSAEVTIDLRMVKGMDGRKTGQQIVDHIRRQGFFVVDRDPTADERRAHTKVAKVVIGPPGVGSRTPMDLPISQEVIRTVESARGRAVKLPTMGGGLPLQEVERPLGTRTIVIPIGNHDNNQHSFDENLRIQNLWDGIELMAALLAM